MKMLAGPGIILYVFIMTFAAIDWVMSLSPHWASTIYGFLFVIGQMISSMSLMIAVLVLLARTAPMEGVIQTRTCTIWATRCSPSSCSGLISVSLSSSSLGLAICLKKSVHRTRLYGGCGVVAVLVSTFHLCHLCSALAGPQAQR